jgi:putative peptidoglycan lipid II flippase
MNDTKESQYIIKGKILRATTILSLSTLITFLIGYLRDVIMIYKFGATSLTDAWFVASVVPEVVQKFLFLGAIGAVFLPTFTRLLEEKGEKRAWEFASLVLNLGFLLLLLLSIFAIFFSNKIAFLFAPGFSLKTRELTSKLIIVLIPVVLFSWISGTLGNILNVYKKFFPSALAPVVNSTVVLLFLAFLSEDLGIFSLAYGSLTGSLLALMVMGLFLYRRSGYYKLKVRGNFFELKEMFLLIIPLAGAELIGKGIGIVDRIFASMLEAGSITNIQLAMKLVSIPVFLFSATSSIAIFPFLSSYSSSKDYRKLKDLFLFGIKINLLISIPSTFGFLILRSPIVEFLFQRGAFTPEDTYITSNLLFIYSLSLIARALIPLFFKTIYALRKTSLVLYYETLYFITNAVLDFILIKLFGLYGIALATTLIVPLLVLFLIRGILKDIGSINFSLLMPFVKKVFVSSLIMAFISFSSYNIFYNTGHFINLFITVILSFVVYILFLYILKTEELFRIREIILKRELIL